jgi:XTP/dITP diphosphohydrolase
MLIVTRNQHKFEEFQRLAPHISWRTLGAWERHHERAPSEIIEDADTFAGNAILKAEAGHRLTGEVTIADDSGLCVDALEGRPGIYSARYVDGTDRDRYLALLEELSEVCLEERGAFFHCALAICGLNTQRLSALEEHLSTLETRVDQHDADSGARELSGQHSRLDAHYSILNGSFIVEARCYGRIATRPSGGAGFGYDPVFELQDGRSFASISGVEKDQISHRGQALRALMKIWKIFD